MSRLRAAVPALALVACLLPCVGPLAAAQSAPGDKPDDARGLQDELARLRDRLESSSEDERLDAAIAIAALRSPAGAPLLLGATEDSSEQVRAVAITGLGAIADASAISAISARLARDKSVLVRKSAAYALGRMRSPAATPALVAALRDKDDEVRGAAAVAMGEYADAAAIQPLVSALSDKNGFVRARAAYALGNMGRVASSAVPQLVKALESDPEHYTRQQAALALGKIGDPAALPALTRASRSPDPHLASEALAAIDAINGK